MKRFGLILFYCIFTLCCYAQQGTLKGDIDTDKFPEVSFVWNEYNPEILHPNQFALKENGKELEFTCENLRVDSIPSANKTILFLWENMPGNVGQFEFTNALLYYFLLKDVADDQTTAFNLALFNRRHEEQSVLDLKLPEFTTDKSVLATIMSDSIKYNAASYFRNSRESDLLSALREGLDRLSKEAKNNTRAIVVVTAGVFMHGIELSPIINQALQRRIPIYIIHYPADKSDDKFALQQLSAETHGALIQADSTPEASRVELLKVFNEIDHRHSGQDYKITFTSQVSRDAKSYPLEINVNGANYDLTRHYKTPDFSAGIWIKDHLILFLALLALAISALTLTLIFGIKHLKKRKARLTAQKVSTERAKANQLAKQAKLEREQSQLQERLRQQQSASELKEQQAIEQQQQERLEKLMYTKNLQPRLIAVGQGQIFSIDRVTVAIGKENDNDITLSDPTVSRHHAQIVFDGLHFEIHDLDSSNGTIVNGNYVESAELNDSDIIQIGEVVLKFYM